RSIKFRGGLLGIKCTRHSHCQVKCSHWQYKFPLPVKVVTTARRLEMLLPEVYTAIEEKKKKLPVKDRWHSKVKGDSVINWGSEEKCEYSEEENVDEKIKWLTTHEEEEKKDNDEDEKSICNNLLNTPNSTCSCSILVQTNDDEFVHGDEYVHDDVDEEMKDAKDAETRKDDEEITNAEKIELTKGDLEQARKLPITSSSLSVSFGFVLSPLPEILSITPATTPPPPSSVSTNTPVL
nr:hypothetical protein [Tanacetum cinerariifolium]